MPSAIQFYKADVSFRFSSKTKISNWIYKVIVREGARLANLNVVFCSDEYLLDINRQFLEHDFYTDIVTFDYSEGKKLSGEIYISIDRVRENAKSLNLTFEIELRRVIIHGVLHLLGYKDKTNAQSKAIRKKEDDCLKIIR